MPLACLLRTHSYISKSPLTPQTTVKAQLYCLLGSVFSKCAPKTSERLVVTPQTTVKARLAVTARLRVRAGILCRLHYTTIVGSLWSGLGLEYRIDFRILTSNLWYSAMDVFGVTLGRGFCTTHPHHMYLAVALDSWSCPYLRRRMSRSRRSLHLPPS